MAEEFTDMGQLPTIEVSPEVGGSGGGTGGGYIGYGSVGNSSYGSVASYNYSIITQNSVSVQGAPASTLRGYNPWGAFSPLAPWASPWDVSAFLGFGDIGGAILSAGVGGFTPSTDIPLDMWYDFGIATMDFPRQAARAFAGVLNAESGGIPWTLGGYKGRATGASQWLGPRRDNLFEFADNLGLLVESFGSQSLFLLDEFAGILANNAQLYEMYDPFNSQRKDATAFVTQFVRPHKGYETNRDINIGAAFFPTGYSDPVRASPLFGLAPLPYEDY